MWFTMATLMEPGLPKQKKIWVDSFFPVKFLVTGVDLDQTTGNALEGDLSRYTCYGEQPELSTKQAMGLKVTCGTSHVQRPSIQSRTLPDVCTLVSYSRAAATKWKKVLARAVDGRCTHIGVYNKLLQCIWWCFPVKIGCEFNFIMQVLALID